MILCIYSGKDRLKINSGSGLSKVSRDNDVDFGQMVNLTRAARFDVSVAGQVAN